MIGAHCDEGFPSLLPFNPSSQMTAIGTLLALGNVSSSTPN
jgi:hypothetical protein